MCESNAYVYRDGKEEFLMDNVILLEPRNNKLYLRSLLGEEKLFNGVVKEIKFMDHKIILQEKSEEFMGGPY